MKLTVTAKRNNHNQRISNAYGEDYQKYLDFKQRVQQLMEHELKSDLNPLKHIGLNYVTLLKESKHGNFADARYSFEFDVKGILKPLLAVLLNQLIRFFRQNAITYT